MIAHVRPMPAATNDDERLLCRADALDDVVSFTIDNRGLSDEAKSAMRRVLLAHIDPLLHLADSAVVATLEAEAIERRISAHVATHNGCAPCEMLRLLATRRARFTARASRAFSDLAMGGRR